MNDTPRRVIKRYTNRKLYDTQESKYITLLQIADIVRGGQEVQIIDNNTKDDLTEITMAQIILEERKANKGVPLKALRELISERTGTVLSSLREGPIGRFLPNSAPPPAREERDVSPPEPRPSKPSLVDQAKGTFEDMQHRVDERIRAVIPSFLPWQQLEQKVAKLEARIVELESKQDKK